MPPSALWLSLALLVPLAASAQGTQSPSRTYANPLDIDYRYNFEQRNEGISYRTGADPVFVRQGDAYYLFLTLADGYWRSTDLLHWTFVTPNLWPAESVVAPAAWVEGERLVLMPSTTITSSERFMRAMASARVRPWVISFAIMLS